jgi:hypothetical protein
MSDPGGWVDLAAPPVNSIVPGLWAASSGRVHAALSVDVAVFEGAVESAQSVGAGSNGRRVVARSSTEAYVVAPSSGPSGPVFRWDGSAWSDTGGAAVADVWLDRTAGTLYAVTEASGLRTRPVGGSWSPVAGSPNGLRLWGTSGTDLWIVDLLVNNTSSLAHWNGTTVDPCTGCLPGVRISDLWGSGSADVFAVGEAGAIRHWDGTAWSTMTSGTSEDLVAVWGSSATDVYAGGTAGMLLHYDGATWQQAIALPTPVINAVWGSGPGDVFAGGSGGLVYHYDGQRWSPVQSGEVTPVVSGATAGAATFYAGSDGAIHRLVRTMPW